MSDEPKRFIRTYESDAAAVKQGAEPGFEEAVEPSEPASARLVSGSILPASLPTPLPEPAKPPAPPAAVASEEAPLHTYTSDFEDQLTKTNASTASVLAAEGDAGGAAPRKGSSFNIPLIAGGILLIILGGAGAYLTYRYAYTPTPVVVTPEAATPIFVNERVSVEGTGQALMNAIAASIQTPLAAGSVRLLSTPIATTTGNDLFHALELPAPDILLRNINAAGSMAGIINASGAPSPFFILQVESYADTFAGMLTWEPTMGKDLAALYPPTATSTLAAFHDETLANHDIRALRDASGASVILYGYASPSILIIARDESSYQEILNRLSTSRTTE